jgi:hypothetical protein
MKSLKTKALEWIYSLYNQHSINDKEKVLLDCPLCFILEGFANEPMIYIKPTHEGLEFGYEATQWNGPIPALLPGVYKKHSLAWETLQSLNKEKQQEMIFELLMKTINARKRQYRKCQFCGEKVAIEHRFDQNTCHGCASEHYGVVY